MIASVRRWRCHQYMCMNWLQNIRSISLCPFAVFLQILLCVRCDGNSCVCQNDCCDPCVYTVNIQLVSFFDLFALAQQQISDVFFPVLFCFFFFLLFQHLFSHVSSICLFCHKACILCFSASYVAIEIIADATSVCCFHSRDSAIYEPHLDLHISIVTWAHNISSAYHAENKRMERKKMSKRENGSFLVRQFSLLSKS